MKPESSMVVIVEPEVVEAYLMDEDEDEDPNYYQEQFVHTIENDYEYRQNRPPMCFGILLCSVCTGFLFLFVYLITI